MRRMYPLSLISALGSTVVTTCALAHAFLDHATPGVGATVRSAPGELLLSFSQDVVPALSGVTLAAVGGGGVPTGKATAGPANTLHVRLGRALAPGTYTVTWRVVSVDTHPTSGTYRFTIAP